MNKTIAIYTLTSELHDEQAVSSGQKEFLGSLAFEYDFRGSDYSDYGAHALSLIYVRTGGTEGIFRRLLPELRQKSNSPFYLLNPIGNHHIIVPGRHQELIEKFIVHI